LWRLFLRGFFKIQSGKGKTLSGRVKFFALILIAGSVAAAGRIASAQLPAGTQTDSQTMPVATENRTFSTPTKSDEVNPVAQVREHRSWEHGPFANGGFGVGDRAQYKFFWAGYQLGKPLTPVFHAGPLSGQFELAGNIIPLWQSYTPAPHYANYTCTNAQGNPFTCSLWTGGGTFYGVSMTPVILRWNFLTRSKRIQPWFQAAGGLIYTTHKYPPNYKSGPTVIDGYTYQLDGGTSVWNFAPQGGVGVHYFTRAKRSIDLGVNGVHISSASLGDRNPGVNASLQVQLGYTFWK
jgi:hypothetical protein